MKLDEKSSIRINARGRIKNGNLSVSHMAHISLLSELNHERRRIAKNKIGVSRTHRQLVSFDAILLYTPLSNNPITPTEINTLEDTNPTKIRLQKNRTSRSDNERFSMPNNFCAEVNAAFLFLCNLNIFCCQRLTISTISKHLHVLFL